MNGKRGRPKKVKTDADIEKNIKKSENAKSGKKRGRPKKVVPVPEPVVQTAPEEEQFEPKEITLSNGTSVVPADAEEQRLLEKKKMGKRDYVALYEKELPGIMSHNVALQQRALQIIEDKIETATAVQAATIFGILADKGRDIMKLSAPQAEKTNTYNMYIGSDGGSSSPEEMLGLMSRVLQRMDGKNKAVDVQATEIKDKK